MRATIPLSKESRWPSIRRRHARRQSCRGLSNLQLTAFLLVITATIVHISKAPIPLSEPASNQMVRPSITLPKSSSGISCSSMNEIKNGKLKVTFAQLNELRRHLLIENRPCFQSNSQFFIETFLNRTSANHVMLHIPKAGGSTLCEQVNKGKIWKTGGDNCWVRSFCPMWFTEKCKNVQPTTCTKLNTWPQTFVMNENYLDNYCDDHTYSIIIREPVSRTISHLSHYLVFVAILNEEYPNHNMNWRYSLLTSNYMVWALSAIALFDVPHSNSTEKIHAKDFHPKKEDLNFAKQRLMQMDYIVDLSHENTTCRDQMLTHMKIGTNLGTTNPHAGSRPGYQHDFRRNDIAATNQLDLELYSFAQELIDADCVFYEMVRGMQQAN